MNTMHSSVPYPCRFRMAIVLLAFALPGIGMAASTAKKATAKTEPINQHPALVLTLPDQWTANSSKPAIAATADEQTATNNFSGKKPAVNVDCAVDANPLTTYDSSLSNRWQGECNLGYRY